MEDSRLKTLLKITARKKVAVKVISHKQLHQLKIKRPTFVAIHFGRKTQGHFVAVYCHLSGRKVVASWIDSFGLDYSYYSTSKPPFIITERVSSQLQHSSSNYCGLYVWFFLYHIVKGFSVKAIQKLFKKSTSFNDKLVKQAYSRFIRENSPTFKQNLSPRFSCTCRSKFLKSNHG